MIGAERTLLSYLDAPVVIGDPEGCAVYANPAFELYFERAVGRVPGAPLAELFEGGAREAVLRAVVVACREGESVRFRLREGAIGFSAVASPIAARGEQVGVVILLKEEVEGVERVLALHREMEQPMDELGQVLQQLFELPADSREARLRSLLADAQQALGRLRKGADEMHAMLTGSREATAVVKTQSSGSAARSTEPSALLHRVAARAERAENAAGRSIDVVAAPGLPTLPGDPHRVEALLLRMLEARLTPAATLERIVLTARSAGGSRPALLISLCELGAAPPPAASPDPPQLREEVAALGAELRTVSHAPFGRATLLRLRLHS